MAIYLPITAHLNTGSQYIWPTEGNSCSLFSQHQLKNAQMFHSDIRNWGKNILLLQKKHMMTNYKGVIQDSVLGVVLATLIFDTHAHCFDEHPYVKVYNTLY